MWHSKCHAIDEARISSSLSLHMLRSVAFSSPWMGHMTMSTLLNPTYTCAPSISCVQLSARSCNVKLRCAKFGFWDHHCTHLMSLRRKRGYKMVLESCCGHNGSLDSARFVKHGVQNLCLSSGGYERLLSFSNVGVSLIWGNGATIGSTLCGSVRCVSIGWFLRDGRCQKRFELRCGSTCSDEGGIETPVVVLDNYLMKELLPPLIYGTVAFTLLGVTIGAGPEVKALADKLGLSFRHMMLFVQIFFLRLPSYIGLALPVASLLASMLAFGRLGVESEIIALQAAGIGSLRLLRPTFIFFMGITALHLLLAEGLTPRANRIAAEAASTAIACITIQDPGKASMKRTFSAAHSGPLIYPEYRKGCLAHLLYAQGFEGSSLLTVTFVQMEGIQDQVPALMTAPCSKLGAELEPCFLNTDTVCSTALSVKRVVLAEIATWDESHGLWMFSNGCEYVLGKPPQRRYGSDEIMHSDESSIDLMSCPKDEQSISLQGVRLFSSEYVSGLSRAPLDLAELGVNKSFDDMAIFEVSKLLALMKASRNVKESRKLQLKIQQRISLPFACTIFGVVGSLLSLHLPREQKQVGLALTFAIIFGYYSVSVFGSLIGQLGYVSPFLGAWLPNLAGALLAFVLLYLSA